MDLWSTLPPDLLMLIVERLESRAQIMNFRAVCKSWRNPIPISLSTPFDILSTIFPYKGIINNNHSSSILVASSVFLLQSCVNPKLEPWLVTVEEVNPGKLFIRAPLSRVALTRHSCSNTILDMSRINVLELSRFYTLRRVDKLGEMFSEKRLSEYDNKVVLFVNPNCETIGTIDDCTLVELYDKVDHLRVTRLKYGSKYRVSFKGREFDDVVNFNGKIYALDFQGRVCFMDYDSLKMWSVTESPLSGCSSSNYKKRLAVLNGELYVVYRRCQISDSEGGAFKVFKLNESKKWVKMDGIGDDKILFVNFDGCFFASVKDIPGWKGNCIVFRRGSFPEYSGIRSYDCKIFENWELCCDVAVFHFENGDCKPLGASSGYSGILRSPSWIHFEKFEIKSSKS